MVKLPRRAKKQPNRRPSTDDDVHGDNYDNPDDYQPEIWQQKFTASKTKHDGVLNAYDIITI